jgi:adenylyltransferase/sulfurtransferase
MMNRYERQIKLSEWGGEAQQRLVSSSVLVIGAGGLGCGLLLDLCGAGVGTIGLVEGDTVQMHNLHRQSLYHEGDMGSSKLKRALDELGKRNSEVVLMGWDQYLDKQLALEIFPHFDLVVDCTDNFASRYLIDDVCRLYGKVWVSGSIHKNQFQLNTFGWKEEFSFRALFPETSDRWLEQDCGELGVLGPIVAMAAHEMALEAMWILGKDESLFAGCIQLIDPIHGERYSIEHSGVSDPIDINTIEARDYKMAFACQMSNPHDIDLEDWNTNHEHGLRLNVGATDSIGSRDQRLSLQDLDGWKPEGDRYLIYCERGKSSLRALAYLKDKFPEVKWHHLAGGIQGLNNE